MACALTLNPGQARAGGTLPTNGQYVAGQGSIVGSGNQLTVNQSSSHGIINWQTFSIGQGNSVFVYAAGLVLGQIGSTGALVGYNAVTGSIGNAYYDAGVTGSLTGAGYNLGTLNLVAMGGVDEPDPTQQSTYVGFDFTGIWTTGPDELPTLLHAP